MVKVYDEEMTAEPRQAQTAPLRHSSNNNNNNSNNNNSISPRSSVHSQNGKSHYHHFHQHLTFPPTNASQATIRFPPGFEPQRVACNRYPQQATASSNEGLQQHVVDFHVYPGVTVSLQMGDSVQVFKGPVTVPMVSTNSSPPIAMPVQVPPGHVVQQIVDESGALRHVILSPSPHAMVPMPTHYGPGPASGSNQPPQPFYAPQGMPPYPPHPYGPLQPGVLPGHSPPPGPTPHYHKDERSQRQYIKLKKKLEQKQQRSDSGFTTPPFSPRKDLINGIKNRTNANVGKDINSAGTSEDGEESSSIQDDEDEAPLIIELLSSVKAPQVADLAPRSALLTWSALTETEKNPELCISEAELIYEVLLSDKAKGGKYRAIYNGRSLSCRIEDLRPGSEYSVCLKVRFEDLQGSASEPLVFTTPGCVPDQPLPPKLISRTKNSLQLRWNAPVENGSPITQYILECDDGRGDGFQDIYKNKTKQHNILRLQASASYKFRLCAVNEFGRSIYSEAVTFCTSGTPPSQPSPPILQEPSVTSLRLAWQKRPTDSDFTLQMDDKKSGHGFLVVYNGKDTVYCVERLIRHSEYKFRLRAQNEEGSSQWSEEVSYCTLPSRPGPPSRPSVKGRIHPHSFKVKWEPPSDRGGADITSYLLEMNSGSGYKLIYEGPDTECTCDRLIPGTSYQLRVSCKGPGGMSDPSDPSVITTEPVCPGPCSPPRLHGRPKPNSLTLKFNYPDYDGGAPVTDLEVEMTAPDASKRLVHHGPETECLVDNLSPGQPYLFWVRALNRAGVGPWSEGVEILSGAAEPDAPSAPHVCCRKPDVAVINWTAPSNNGAPIKHYQLESSFAERDEYRSIYIGDELKHECKGLLPNTSYCFRVLATNSAGPGPYSSVTQIRTPPSPPSTVGSLRYTATSSSITLSWAVPSSNGSDILHYNVDIGEKVLTCTTTEYTIHMLRPQTNYRVRVQAVNGVGAGPFSSILKAATLPLPPVPPHLECVNIGHNFLKLKWGDGKNLEHTNYILEMELKPSEFYAVYTGLSQSYKATKLQEMTAYNFRIAASNDAGQGDFSEVATFTTGLAPPPTVKGLKTMDICQRSCTVEWQPCKIMSNDPVLYQVQLSRVREQDYKQVYRGESAKFELTDLEAGADYNVKVCPIRMSTSGELCGPYTPVVTFSTLPAAPQTIAQNKTTVVMVTENRQFTDQQWAIIILSIFSLFAVLVAVLMQYFIDVGGAH